MLPPMNIPPHELSRSVAAAAIGVAAQQSGLILSHFERRVHLAPPDAWLPVDRPDLRARGQRPDEHKYQHHHNENPVGSFNPGHRAKWTAHELCHALVGFAWCPDATPLFRLLSARLSEVVPVALWYFFDEAGLRRCEAHDGPLFGAWCPACEAAAGTPDPKADLSRWRAEGLAFVERELAAIRKSMRLGRPVAHRWATLDLHSDALAYTVAHAGRLTSPAFARYAELFHGTDALGCHRTLDALIDRAEAVARALAHGEPITPLTGEAASMRAQDIGWRLLMTAADCEGEAARTLDALAETLATNPHAMGEVIEGYTAAADAWWLPPPRDLFAVGYPLPGGHGLGVAATEAALARSCPNGLAILGDRAPALIESFVDAELERGPVARRFAAWLGEQEDGVEVDLLRYEAACAHPGPADPLVDSLGAAPGAPLMRAEHLDLLRLNVDADGLIRALEAEDDAPIDPQVERPVAMVVRRRAGGDVLVAEISAEAAAALTRLADGPCDPEALGLPPAELASLISLGVVRPARWPIA